jgi:peptide subunit release factor 1 (eRF1)
MFSSLIFEPKQAIKKNFYRCDSKFHLDNIVPMYDDALEHRIDGAIYVDGSSCIMYRVQDNRVSICEKIDIRLISQFKNGGQSANRLERIVDENRATYVGKVVDVAIKTFYDKQENTQLIANLVVFGPSRFKDDVVSYRKGKLAKYFKSIDTITTSDENQIDEVIDHLNNQVDPIELEVMSEIQELIELADSRLEFGQDTIKRLTRECMLGRIVISERVYDEFIDDDLNYEPDIIILRSANSQDWIEIYGGCIGLRWY